MNWQAINKGELFLSGSNLISFISTSFEVFKTFQLCVDIREICRARGRTVSQKGKQTWAQTFHSNFDLWGCFQCVCVEFFHPSCTKNSCFWPNSRTCTNFESGCFFPEELKTVDSSREGEASLTLVTMFEQNGGLGDMTVLDKGNATGAEPLLKWNLTGVVSHSKGQSEWCTSVYEEKWTGLLWVVQCSN